MSIGKNEQINILFLGNSFTYYNDMPTMLEQLGIMNGYQVHVEQLTYGGYSLFQFINEVEVASKVKQLFREKHWDYVILQDQSSKPLYDKLELISSIASLDKMIKQQDGKTILYSTWSYRDDSAMLQSTTLTYDDFYNVLTKGYEEAGELVHAVVAPVGTVFHKLTKEYSEIDLIIEDDFHPNIKGSFVAAYVFYSLIFGNDNSSYIPDDLNEKDAEILRKVVQEIVS